MPASPNLYTNIAITGASSGLGRAIAIAYAHPGVTLHLSARNAGRLAEVTATCRSLGAGVSESLGDVTSQAGMESWIASLGQLDLVVANAGISAGPGNANTESPAQMQAIFATNVEGVFNTVMPASAAMAKQPVGPNGNRGRIAIIGSIAGLIALPNNPTYCAAKAALDFWVRASAPNLAREGIALTIIRPGFIRTPMTARNPYKMPGIMDADQAAERIRAGLAEGRHSITFPYWFGIFARLGDLMPKAMFNKMPRKPA